MRGFPGRSWRIASGYRHVSYEERCQIDVLRKEGLSMAAVARRLGRNVSTISRELGRNSGGRGYRHQQAQGQAEARRREASSVPRKLTAALQELVAGKLRLRWSPEQIAGWLALEVNRERVEGKRGRVVGARRTEKAEHPMAHMYLTGELRPI